MKGKIISSAELEALTDGTFESELKSKKKLIDKNESNVSKPVERNGAGKPSLIFNKLGKGLNNKQKRILEKLNKQDTVFEFDKKEVSMKDLAALTAETGDEFSMFTKNGKRLVFRGNPVEIKALKESKGKELNNLGYKWSGHTHPLSTDMPNLDCLDCSEGDLAFLEQFNQDGSVIYNSKGQHRRFSKND